MLVGSQNIHFLRKSGQSRDMSGQSRDISGHSENHNYVEWNGREHQKTIRSMHTIIEVTVFVFSLCYPHRNLLYQSTTKIVKKNAFFLFSLVHVWSSRAVWEHLHSPKLVEKKSDFFLDPHWNSLGACNFLWGLMVIEELQAKSRTGGGLALIPPGFASH